MGFPRTTNHCESWHNRWNILLGKPNVGLHSIINALQKEEYNVRSNVAKLDAAGRLPSNHDINMKKREDNLRRLISSRTVQNIPYIAFLKKVTRRLSE